jgi:hypothetical protein
VLESISPARRRTSNPFQILYIAGSKMSVRTVELFGVQENRAMVAMPLAGGARI